MKANRSRQRGVEIECLNCLSQIGAQLFLAAGFAELDLANVFGREASVGLLRVMKDNLFHDAVSSGRCGRLPGARVLQHGIDTD